MRVSGILFFKLKLSLIALVLLLFLSFFFQQVFMPMVFGNYQSTLSNWAMGGLFFLLILVIEWVLTGILFQFNVTRKLNFLMGILNMMIIGLVSLILVTLMNEFIKTNFDSYTFNTGPQLDYFPFHFKNSYFNFLIYQFKSFVTLMLCGSLALLVTQFLIRHPHNKVIHTPALWFIPISLINSITIPYLGWIEHPFMMISILSIGTLVILKITYKMVKKFNAANHSKGGF